VSAREFHTRAFRRTDTDPDEPTSAIDMSTGSNNRAIENLMQGRTTITIAHRLSTLENCDVIFELEGGRLTRIENRQET
jgi:ABC-type multidrug transport system fused ATPase/permease subunit